MNSAEKNRRLWPKKRELIELIKKYEGLKADYGRDANQTEVARAWKVGKMLISNYSNAMRHVPEWRLVWMYKRYKSLGCTPDEIFDALIADYPSSELKERASEYEGD